MLQCMGSQCRTRLSDWTELKEIENDRMCGVLWCFSRVRLCDPVDCNPPDSSVHGVLQARTLEWIAISFSRGSSQGRDQTHIACVSPALAGRFLTTEPPGKPNRMLTPM